MRHEIVHAGFGCDRRGGQRIVAGDHHGSDSHLAQLREAFLDSAFDHVLELDRAERQHVGRDDERRAARCEISSTVFVTGCGNIPPADSINPRIASAAPLRMRIFGSEPLAWKIDTAHARLRRERDEGGLQFVHHLARAIRIFLWPARQSCGLRAFHRPASSAALRPRDPRRTPGAG